MCILKWLICFFKQNLSIIDFSFQKKSQSQKSSKTKILKYFYPRFIKMCDLRPKKKKECVYLGKTKKTTKTTGREKKCRPLKNKSTSSERRMMRLVASADAFVQRKTVSVTVLTLHRALQGADCRAQRRSGVTQCCVAAAHVEVQCALEIYSCCRSSSSRAPAIQVIGARGTAASSCKSASVMLSAATASSVRKSCGTFWVSSSLGSGRSVDTFVQDDLHRAVQNGLAVQGSANDTRRFCSVQNTVTIPCHSNQVPDISSGIRVNDCQTKALHFFKVERGDIFDREYVANGIAWPGSECEFASNPAGARSTKFPEKVP